MIWIWNPNDSSKTRKHDSKSSWFRFSLMAWFTAAIWIESRRGTENIYAVLHQRSISIQHEHMCEVLGAQQVFVKHPQLLIHSKQSWCSHSSQKTEGTAIKQRNTAAKAQMLFPIEILPFVVSGTGPWQTPLESDNSECLQVEDGTFQYISLHTTKLQNRRDKRGEHAFSTILCLALTSKSLLIHLATSPTLPFGQLRLRWLPAQNHTVTMYPWAVSSPKQDLQCSRKSNWIEDRAFAILPEHYQSVLQNPCQKEQCEKTYLLSLNVFWKPNSFEFQATCTNHPKSVHLISWKCLQYIILLSEERL